MKIQRGPQFSSTQRPKSAQPPKAESLGGPHKSRLDRFDAPPANLLKEGDASRGNDAIAVDSEKAEALLASEPRILRPAQVTLEANERSSPADALLTLLQETPEIVKRRLRAHEGLKHIDEVEILSARPHQGNFLVEVKLRSLTTQLAFRADGSEVLAIDKTFQQVRALPASAEINWH